MTTSKETDNLSISNPKLYTDTFQDDRVDQNEW
jgi:hypothetical protein